MYSLLHFHQNMSIINILKWINWALTMMLGGGGRVGQSFSAKWSHFQFRHWMDLFIFDKLPDIRYQHFSALTILIKLRKKRNEIVAVTKMFQLSTKDYHDDENLTLPCWQDYKYSLIKQFQLSLWRNEE